MTEDLFSRHESMLDKALNAIETREYWSPFPESPRGYGEDAPGEGEAAFKGHLGRRFELDQPSATWSSGSESSPYGVELGISYPVTGPETLLGSADSSMPAWSSASLEERTGVCLEIIHRLSQASFEMAHAVMQTTGQGFIMAFQAGGPHALDRALEAVAYAYREIARLPRSMRWEKPQGKRDPIVVDKTWRIRPRGVAITIGVSTFPTWNGYPGIFASLATGNPVIVKPHPATILPLAIFVAEARNVLAGSGFDPNIVQLGVDTIDSPIAKDLVSDPRVGIVDYTGGSAFGDWLESNVGHAAVFTEKSGVNSVIVDGVDDLKGLYRNLSVSLSMYSGQMCTTPQNIFVPREGIEAGGDHVDFDEVVAGLTGAIGGLLADDERAADVLGSIKDQATLERIREVSTRGEVVLGSREVKNPRFPRAAVRTPVVVALDSTERDVYMREMFGPIVFVVATESTAESLQLAAESALESGAITWLVYTENPDVEDATEEAAVRAGVPVAFNLTGSLYVNQSAAYSDFHVTGANPAGNASLTDPAFVAGRFRVVGVRKQG